MSTLDSARLEAVLARLTVDARAYFGAAHVRLVPVATEDRPFSHVLRASVYLETDEQPATHVFVKLFRPKLIEGGPDALRDRVERDFEATRHAHSALARFPDLGAVPPIACYPELLAIVTEEVVGETLLQYLERRIAWRSAPSSVAAAAAVAGRVGRWIREFQSGTPAQGSTSPQDIADYIDIRLRRLVQHSHGSFSPDHRRRLLAHIHTLGDALSPHDLQLVMAHSDLSLGNLLVAGERIVGLDFAMARMDTRLYDLTKVFMQLDLLRAKPRFRPAAINALQAALLREFDSAVCPDAPLFRLILLQHRINHLTTLYVNSNRGFAAVYNYAVRRQHHRWLRRELSRRETQVGVPR